MTEKSIPMPFAGQPGIPAWITLLIAVASGAIVANLYYAQPLAGPISASTGLPPGAAGLVVTLTQIGYCLGLLFIVPLGDLLENRRLIVGSLAVTVVALAGVALAAQAWQFLTATLLVGLGSVAAQVLVPYAAHLAPDAVRGRVVGNVMSGLLLGILLARPVASLIANALGWHWVFGLSALLITVLAIVLGRTLPPRHPRATIGYGALMRSLWTLLRETPVLRRRSAYHALLFASFSLFWTVVPLLLAGPRFHLTQAGIAWFALAGVAGAVSAPVAGRLADSGWTRPATGFALGVSALAFVILHVTRGSSTAALLVLVFAAVLLDMGVSANLVLGQRAIFALGATVRSRLNGLYMAIFFAGGATGSALGGFAYARGGWPLATLLGLGMPVAALALYATEFRRPH